MVLTRYQHLYTSHEDERRLYRCRNDQKREYDGEVLPRGVTHMEPEWEFSLSLHPADHHRTEPQTVGGCDKKCRDLEYTVG